MEIRNWNNWPKWKKKRTMQIIVRCTLFTLMVSVLTIKLLTGIGYAESLEEDPAPVMYHSHYVESGETLWDIANEYSNDKDIQAYIAEICNINQIDNKDDIQYGTYIIVPIYE